MMASAKPRPGAKLDHRFTVKIMQPRAGKDVFCGTLDTRQRVYQRGVSLTTQVYWKLRLVSFGLQEWQQIAGGQCERIEFTDLKSGKCWAADYDRAAMEARLFTGENGSPRIGVPLDVFEVDDALSLSHARQAQDVQRQGQETLF